MTAMHPAVAAADRIDLLRRRDPALRRLVLDVRTWALANGLPSDIAALTAVVGTVLDMQHRDGTDPGHWDTGRVAEFVWLDAPLWCRRNQTVVPVGTADALRLWWRYLEATGGLAPAGDERAVLERTLCTHAGRGRHRPTRAPRERDRHG